MRTCRLALFSLAFIAFAVPAIAQESAADKEAKSRFKEGKALYAAGKVEDARLKFLQACAVLTDDGCLRNLSVAEFNSGHFVEAHRDIKRVLSRGSLNAQPALKVEFEKLLREAYDKIGHVQVKGSDGASVILDEHESVGTCPIVEVLEVLPGKHSLTARKDEVTRTSEVNATAGQLLVIDLTFPVDPPPVISTPIATPIIVAPPTLAPAPPIVAEPPRSSPLVPAGIVIGGLGVAGLVTGVVAAMISSKDANNARSAAKPGDCVPMTAPACNNLQSMIDAGNTLKTVSIASYIGGGVAFAAGVLMVGLGVSSNTRSKTSFVPYLLPGAAGVGFHGSF